MAFNADGSGVRFQILALDGGGLRGIFAASALAQLQDDFETDIVKHFDLIAGTSTGALIALALAAGRSPQEIVAFYLEQGPTIFPAASWRRLRRLWRPYRQGPLRKALESILGGATLADSRVRLAIPAFDQTSNDVYLFRTPHQPGLRRDRREQMVDVALAATAAPTFLPAHHLGGLRLIDGGVWAVNPTMVALVEALASCNAQARDVHILNVGATTHVVHRSRRLDDGLPFWWAREIVDVALRGQALSATNYARLLLPPGQVHRLDVPVPKGLHGLDRVDAEDLIGQAMASSRRASPSLADFFSHIATPHTWA